MDSVAVTNEQTNHYVSYSVGGEPVTPALLLKLLVNNVEFAGPFTLVEERDVYLPQDDEFDGCTLYPDKEILVYDSYGPHGVQRIGTGYTSTTEVKEWIDDHLEAESPGEYGIGHIINPEDLE